MSTTINVLEIIGEKLNHCSKGQKKIGEYLLENYANAAYMTAAKLGSIVNVSESTVVRSCSKINYPTA